MGQCTAKSKRSGERCKNYASVGKTVCHIHGGKSLSGPASPQFRTGRYSKFLPARLADRYQEARTDAELLSLREEVALLDARMTDLLAQVNTGEAGEHWEKLSDLYQYILRAGRAKDTDGLNVGLTRMGTVLREAKGSYEAWGEVGRLMEQRRRLVESERRRYVEMQQVITAERATLLISVLVDIVRRHISDRDTLSAIVSDVDKLLTLDVPGGVDR